nr:glycosyltransferase family 9 protein [Chloroflexota bacterium]
PAPEHATLSALRLTSVGLETVGALPLEKPYTAERYPLRFVPTPEEQHWVTERLEAAGIGAETPVVVIHPGSGAAVKLWRPEAWSVCADTLAASSTTQIVLTGGKGEQALLEEIAQRMTAEALLVTDATVGQLAALLQRARLVLGVDSGPLHLAVAQTTPTVEIFGPSDPRIFGPWGAPERHIVVQARHRCPTCPAIPCNRLAIPAEEVAAHPCVRLVTEQEVLAAAGRLGHVRHVV